MIYLDRIFTMTDSELNEIGYKLVNLLSIEDIESRDGNSDNFKNIKGIPKIISITEIENFVETVSDPYGRTVASYVRIDNKRIGLNPNEYKILQILTSELLTRNNINQNADVEYIEKVCFNWVISVYKSKKADKDLIPFLLDCLDNELSCYTFYYKMEAIGIEHPFSVGLVELISFDKEFFDREYKLLNAHRPLTRIEFDKTYKDFQNKIIATIKVNAVSTKAEKIAKHEINLSINALKCVLIQESIQSYNQILDVDFNFNSSAFSIFLSRNDASDSALNINMNRNFGAAPIIITESKLSHYNKHGLERLSNFLRVKNNSELYYKTEDAINQFGDVISTRDLYERVVKLISFFESAIVPATNNKAKGQTYLKINVLPKLPFNRKEELKPIITRFYEIRDKYLHNRIELPIDLHELFEMQKLGLVFLLTMVDLNKTLTSIDDLLLHFEIKP